LSGDNAHSHVVGNSVVKVFIEHSVDCCVYAINQKSVEFRLGRSTVCFLPRHVVGILVALSFGQKAYTQQTTTPDQKTSVPTLNVTSSLVLLDVVVTDEAGNPVTNLTKDDFVVYEDKVTQRMVSFEPPSAHTFPMETGNVPFNPDDPKTFGQSPVTILVLDELNTHFEDSSFAVRSVRQYLESRPAVLAQPTTLMVVSDNKFRVLKNFTRDRTALLKALKDQSVHYAWKLEGDKSIGYGAVERLDQSLSALEQIAQASGRIPGRKNLVWVGQGFPTLDPTELDMKDLVSDTIQHVTDVLLNTRVTLYAVDPTSSAAGMTEITDATQLEFAQLAGDALTSNADPFNSSLDFDRLGPVTGGRVLRGMNDIDKQIALSVDLGTKFYTIGYSPSNASKQAGQYRNIRVVCLRPGLTATTRNGYYTTAPASQNSREMLIYDLNTAALSSIPLTALRVTVEPAKTEGAYTVHVDASSLAWQTTNDGGSSAKVVVLLAGLSSSNKILTHTVQNMSALAKPGADLTQLGRTANFSIMAPLPKGVVRLRFVVRDVETGRMGTSDLSIRHF
jgi:VWFA-related protein